MSLKATFGGRKGRFHYFKLNMADCEFTVSVKQRDMNDVEVEAAIKITQDSFMENKDSKEVFIKLRNFVLDPS